MTNFESTIKKFKYIAYKEMLTKDVSFFGTYDMGELNTYKNSHHIFQNIFGWNLRNFITCLFYILWILKRTIEIGSIKFFIVILSPVIL